MKFIKNTIVLVTVTTMILMLPSIMGFGVGLICRLVYLGWHVAWCNP